MLVVFIILVFTLRINIFRLCRLVLDIFPNVLRIIFKNEFQQKFFSSWEDNPTSGDFLVRTDRWQAQLCKAHLNYLQNGNCAEWDSTVLFHVLLHSSLCLFADKFEGTQCIITAQSNVVFPSVPSINFKNVLRNGYKVIFDLGRDQFQTDIVNVQKNCFHIQHVFNPKHGIYSSQMTVDMYICQKKWLCIEELAKLQNNHFAHCQEARIGAAHLHSLIEHAESIFVDLKVSAKVITAMKAIEKGL